VQRVKTTSRLGWLLVLLMAAGCGQPPTFEQELAVATGRVAELEMALGESQAGHEEEVERLRNNARIERQEYVNTIQQLRTELKSKSNLVLALQQTLTRTRTQLRQLQDELAGLKEPAAPPSPEEPELEEAASAPPMVLSAEGAPAPPASFPLRVEDLQVSQVVEGIRVQTIPRTEATSSGPSMTEGLEVEQQTTTEYGYQLRFILRNPTSERKTVSVSAGKSTALLTVPAFGLKATVITAEKDHPLTLIVDEQTAEFPVTY
jgi:hypothetical protein